MIKLFLSLFIPILLFANPFENIKTFQGDFTQSIVNNSGKMIRYYGKMYAKHPNQIFWKYNDPILKDVYLNRSEVVIVEPELEQVIITSIDKEINLLKLLQDATKIAPNHYKSSINNMEYSIFLRDDHLSKIRYTDAVDNTITIFFENTKINQTLDKRLFTYTIPEEFDIIQK